MAFGLRRTGRTPMDTFELLALDNNEGLLIFGIESGVRLVGVAEFASPEAGIV